MNKSEISHVVKKDYRSFSWSHSQLLLELGAFTLVSSVTTEEWFDTTHVFLSLTSICISRSKGLQGDVEIQEKNNLIWQTPHRDFSDREVLQ